MPEVFCQIVVDPLESFTGDAIIILADSCLQEGATEGLSSGSHLLHILQPFLSNRKK